MWRTKHVPVSIHDPNSERLEEVTEEIVAELEDESIIRNVQTSLEDTAPELQVLIDEDAALEEGLVPAQIAEIVNNATNGQTATAIETEDNDIYQVNVRYQDEVLESIENFENLSLQNQDGEYITLADVATIEEGESPATINRADMTPAVDFDVVYESSGTLGETSAVVADILDDIELDDEAEFVIGGDEELMNEAFENMALAFALGLIFIYLVMVAQFESFKYPFVIMFTVPLFVIGVMLALTVTQTPISVIALIGVIVLAGIVVNNAIVLVDYINQKKEKGLPSREAIIEGVKDRTRPILITALTTILGVTPLALAIGEGTEMQQPMGIVVIGGLISSTLLTLFVIPVIYSLFDKETRSMNKKFVTPDGEIVYARDLKKKEETGSEEYELSEQQALPEPEQSSVETRETSESGDYSKDEIVHILEELVRRSKQRNDSKEDKDEEK
ncbi:efflux RND transporter permease subunit [Thalassobacillus sp. C254]|uniref:efflux RND transporter permease subunit n=1 Tax=Thalassobacillus sp. C254 TaxID=1225341 RepID=UPI00277D0A8E|nr:efflux RND transporter permease subunit [Thalassobacillus sp. C254]